MDNITHSLVGAVLAQTGLKRKTRKGTAALILGANAPDIDVFFGSFPWEPLATHRGFTHGFLGALIVIPVLLAGLLWLIDRWQVKRGRDFGPASAMDWRWLFALSLIGCATHPLLDWQTTYAVQLYSPFSTRWYHVDTLFIIDLWIWIALGGAYVLSRLLEKNGRAWQRPAIATLAAMLAYIGANGLITRQALAALGPSDRAAASPPPVQFWKRDLVGLSDGEYRWAYFNPIASVPLTPRRGPEPAGMSDQAVWRAVAADAELVTFMRWSIMPLAKVERRACEATVTISDARYEQAFTRGNFEHVIVVPEPCP